MQCSVVIPCHNGAGLTHACLESLLGQGGDHDLEVLLVDNASTDGTAALAALDPRIRVLPQRRNLGFAGGVNAGLRAARHPLLLVLNNDTQAATNLLDELEGALAGDPRIGAVAPVSNHVKGPACLELGGATRDPEVREAVAHELGSDRGRLQDVETLSGLCLLLRRAALDEVGLFDERFGHGNYEDDDLCLRLRLHGYRLVIARSAFLHHEGHATFRTLGLDLGTELLRRCRQFHAKWQDDPAGQAVIAAASGQLQTAATAARAARAAWPRWPDADWHEGRGRLAAGDHEGAASCFRRLLAHCPRHTDAALELGLCLLLAGDAAGAQRQLSWTAAHCHVSAAAQARLSRRIGEHHAAGRRWAAAAGCFEDALAITPDDGALHNWLGSCRLELGRVEAAEAAFTAAAARGYPLAHTNLGICAHRRGDVAAAERHFATACQLLPDDAVAAANLAAFRRTLQPIGP